MFKLILPLSMALASCKPVYKATICPKDINSCAVGSIEFGSLEECERWAKEASRVQTNVVRICYKPY